MSELASVVASQLITPHIVIQIHNHRAMRWGIKDVECEIQLFVVVVEESSHEAPKLHTLLGAHLGERRRRRNMT